MADDLLSGEMDVPGGPTAPIEPSIDDVIAQRAPALLIDPEIAEYSRKESIRDDAEMNVTRGAMRDPDEFARYVRLAEKTGLDPEMLMTDSDVRQVAEQRDRVRGIDFDRIKESAPSTMMFISDPVNAGVAYDDIENLSAIEVAYQNVANVAKVGRAALAGAGPGLASDTYGAIAAPFGLASRYFSQPMMDVLRRNNIEPGGNIPYVDIFGMGEQFFLDLAKRTEGTATAIEGRTGNEGVVMSGAMSGGRSFGAMGATILAAWRNPNKILDLMTGLTFGNAYQQGREKGLEAGTAATFATAQATVERATEMIPVKYLFQNEVFKKNFVKSFINYQVKEGVGEQVATVLQDFNEWVMLNPDKTAKEYLAERPNAALQTAIATAVASTGQVALVGTVDKLTSRNMQTNKAFFDALAKGVTDSKLHKRLPEKTREFITKLKESGDIKDVFIDAAAFRKYFQSEESTPEKAAAELLGPDGPKKLAEAEALGADVVIPLEIYAEKVAGTKFHEALADDLRLNQGDMSVNEAKLQQANLTEEERNIAKAVADAEKRIAGDTAIQRIYDDVVSQATNVGVPPSQAETWATIVADRYRTRGARLGVDPKQLWDEAGGLEIAREGMPLPEGALQLEQESKNPFKESVYQEPVYHGTIHEFDKFDRPKQGVFFTPIKSYAGVYGENGRVISAYVDIRNPLNLAPTDPRTEPFYDRDYDAVAELIKEAKSQGYDAIKFGGESDAFIVFDDAQIVNADTMTLMQSAPVWYSGMAAAIEKAKFEKGGGAQWKGFINNLPGVKKDEIKWSGIEEWLDITFGPITKADVLEFIQQNGVQIEEQMPTSDDVAEEIPDFAEDAAHEQVVSLWNINATSPDMLADSWTQLLDTVSDNDAHIRWVLTERRRILLEMGFTQEGSYRFERYQLPGGEDYHELVLQVPSGSIGSRTIAPGMEQENEFREPRHYDLPNVLAHVRFNTRIDTDGKRVLFLEEMQSDWAQQGRTQGFGKHKIEPYGESYIGLEGSRVWPVKVIFPDGEVQHMTIAADSFEEAADYLYTSYQTFTSDIPEGPFVQNTDAWVGLITKRMIRYAAENGFDRIAWTTGNQQNERWGGEQEGVKQFYDSVMPKAMAKVLKQFGGKLSQVNLGVYDPNPELDKWEPEDGIGDGSTVPVVNLIQPGFDVTPEMRAKALEGMPLFQENRGMVQMGEQFRRISLLENADLTTFIHEMGHTWLEELQADAAREGAPSQLVSDWETARRWMGLAPGEAVSVAAHEKFARGIEAYFMEGKAPNTSLRRVFYKVKQWMISVYNDIANLNVRLNDDVRAVFDRLIALDDEIDRARAANGFVAMFSDPDAAGMTEAEHAAYLRQTESARQAETERMVAEVAKELEREQSAEWAENLKSVTAEVRAEVEQLPVYRAIWALTHDKDADGNPIEKIKLSKDAIIEIAGEDVIKSLQPSETRTGWVYTVKGGVHPDFAAKMFGFKTGADLIGALANVVPIKEEIASRAQAVMNERFGDPMDPGQLAEKADEIVHSDRQADLLATELKILRRAKNKTERVNSAVRGEARRQRGEERSQMDAPIPMSLIKDVAYQQISETRANDVRPEYYLYAEIREGKKAQSLAAAGKFPEAAEAKQRQVLNFFLYREAVKAKKEIDKITTKAQNLTKKSAQKRIGMAGQEWLEQLNDILNRYSLITMPRTEKARSMVEWARSVKESTGEEIALAPGVLDDANRINFRELTMNELRAVYDSIASIEHVAKKLRGIIRNGVEYEKDLMVAELVDSVNQIAQRPMPNLDKDLSTAASVVKMVDGFFSSTLRPEKIFERLDSGKTGVWHDLFWTPSVDAQNFRDDLRLMVMAPIAEFNESRTVDQKSKMNETITITTMGGQNISRRQMVGIALNVGNVSNLDKLKRGGMWFGDEFTTIDDAQLSEILDHMEQHEWDLVQKIWDSIDALYPYLNELNIRAVGVPLEKIEASAIETKFGKYRGGYWPAVADPRHSKVGEEQENSETLITGLFAPRYPKAATTHSFREERTRAAYPLQFDWERVLSNHVNKAITDIAYHEWVKQSRRLLESQAVKKSIQNTVGDEIYRSLEEWLVHQVIPIHGGYSANQPVDNLTNTLLSNTVVAALGFRASTAIANLIVAPVQSMHQVKGRYLIQGMSKFLRHPTQSIKAVHQMSGEMRHRFEHFEQTFNIVMSELEGKNTIRANVAKLAMMIHLYMDRVSSTAIWMAKYQQEIDAGFTPDQAKLQADKTIRTTQTAGAPKDLSSFERDPRYKIFKMFIGPMIIMQNEMRGSVAGKGAKALIAPEVWATMFATWLVPAVLFEIMAGRGPDDDEEWWEWATRKIALYPALTMPFIRDAASAAEAAITGREQAVRSNPITDTLIQIVRSTKRALSDDAEIEDISTALIRSAGALTGLPANQIIITKDFMHDVANGEFEGIEDLRYLIYRRPE